MQSVIAATSFRDTSAEEWELAFPRSRERDKREAGGHVLALLRSQVAVQTSGFQVNSYTHALQSATKALQAGMDEEYVVCALLHDVGEFLDPFNRGDIAGEIIKNFVRHQPGGRYARGERRQRALAPLSRHVPLRRPACRRRPGQVFDAIQKEAFAGVPVIPLGQYFPPTAYRTSLAGVLDGTNCYPWNVRRV